jgi:hypothetical protein
MNFTEEYKKQINEYLDKLSSKDEDERSEARYDIIGELEERYKEGRRVGAFLGATLIFLFVLLILASKNF